jgi:hypothetical protein
MPSPARGSPFHSLCLMHEHFAMNPTEILSGVCALLAKGATGEAAATIARSYPFAKVPPSTRTYSESVATKVFVRDGFIDRYTGERLIFPGTLRLLSLKLPEVFPYHRNWKISATHPAYWQLCATLDHKVPVSRGGDNDSVDNLVTTSMPRNSAKAHWLLEELGWSLKPCGDFAEWDGLLGWFIAQTAADSSLLQTRSLRIWRFAAELYAAA